MINGEENLIKDAIKGKAEAFGLLYDYYQPKIFRFVLFKTSRQEEAEDLTHQVFLKAWQNISSYKHQGLPFSSWLYQIARNKVIDYYRYNSSRQTVKIESVNENFLKSNVDLETNLEDLFNFQNIIKSISKLTPDQQDVILMRFVEDMPIKEIAATIKKTEGAIKLIQHRAIKKLKKILKDG